MEGVNGAYKHIRYKQIWLKSLGVLQNICVATQHGWPAGQMNTTDS